MAQDSTLNQLTQGMSGLGDNLYYDPTTGTFQQYQAQGAQQLGKWMWGDQGLTSLGSTSDLSYLTPFLDIAEQYRGGAPIEAATWQDAVRQSLTGFMRANYGTIDPIFNWNTEGSGAGNSQFRLGTLAELSNMIPGFFDTSGVVRNVGSGAWDSVTGAAGNIDPLLGFSPEDKFLAFEDIPLSSIEKMVGTLPGQFFVNSPEVTALQQQRMSVLDKYNAVNARMDQMRLEGPSYGGTSQAEWEELDRQSRDLGNQLNSLMSQIQSKGFMSLDQLRQSGLDYNDYLFKLDINPYQEAAQMIKASPESVLRKFMSTPEYQLLYGNDPTVNDPTKSPEERFRADPGYQYQQAEAARQVQTNAAARGLINSGPVLKELSTNSQNIADQSYQRWLAQQQSLFGNWQNQLASQAGQGAQLSSQLGNQATGTGSELANLASALGANLAQLLTGQGAFGSGALLNTGAAQSSNVMSAAAINAQIAAQNAASQSAGGGGSGGGKGGGGGGLGSALGGFGGSGGKAGG